MNEQEQEQIPAANGHKKFDWTFGCKGCEDRKQFLVENKGDLIFLALVLLGLFAVTRIKITNG